MEKKFIVKVVPGRLRFDVLKMMHNLASMLRVSYDIPIVRLTDYNLTFDTPNVQVRYINDLNKLRGLRPDEIFGCDPETRAYRRKPSNTLPYDGGILDYILEVEKGAVEKEKEPEQVCEYDILEFLEKVMGLELTELQKDTVKMFKWIHDNKCKVVYGRGGKIHVVPVEDKEDFD